MDREDRFKSIERQWSTQKCHNRLLLAAAIAGVGFFCVALGRAEIDSPGESGRRIGMIVFVGGWLIVSLGIIITGIEAVKVIWHRVRNKKGT